ncbi:M23 family metallopeptidase [Streptacidiphilus rugosus]|uniref:M23 family metallopeptidase n=1 Tax=Streptacidiphilus rugosus TaxID=405783 RepID=UPI0012F969B1|nr:M23 family metallopeptidase [Streptacidiphilus rugosus]
MGKATRPRLRASGSANDPVVHTLVALFGATEVEPALVSAALLRRVPVQRLQESVDGLRERHGELRSVRRHRDLHQLVFAHGSELVWARLDEAGLLTSFVTGPGALTARLAASTIPAPARSSEDLPTPAPAAPAEAAPGPSGPPKPAAVARLQRTVLAYAAATAAELTFPWLTGTATGWLLVLAQTPAFAWYALRTAPTHALPPWFRSLPLVPAVVAVLAYGRVLGLGLRWGFPGLPEIGLCVGVVGLAAWTWRRSLPVPGAPTAHPLVLRSPLRDGTFVCTEAGGPAVNRHAEASLAPGGDRALRYAADLVQLGSGPQWRGRRALGLAPATNERYAIFGHPVLSPVDGVILAAVDGLPDHAPGGTSAGHPDGNHVRIGTDRGVVVLSGLREDSVLPRRGQHVAAGTPLGTVGNSASAPEPSLRLRAENSVGLGLPFRLTELRGDLTRNRRITVTD